jgi:2-dehydro-3-deoxyphosphogluconate aldolase/(4S)-4-hydroxy-2-oxoglutarate aldolase
MAKVRGAIVGAGTVLNEAQLDQATNAGACFIVSPGLTDRLSQVASRRRVSLLPGVSSASEIMRALELGYDRLKFFPAEVSGGTATLKAMGGPFPDVRFCPTGGITQENAGTYLALRNVRCVGGSWLYRSGESDWAAVTARARAAASLVAARG